MRLTRGRRRHIETTGHVCPHPACAYHGSVDGGNRRAHGHPRGRRWRQLGCLSCHRPFLATHGTPLHGKRVEPDQLGWAIAALAEGLGLRAVARVCESAPQTVLGWLVEAAEPVEAFARDHWHDLHGAQVQMDARCAWRSAVKQGEVPAALAIQRLSRAPHWVGSAMDPVCTRIRTIDGGERPRAMAHRRVHQSTHVLAPDCAPLLLPDGLRAYVTARGTHSGRWNPPERRQGTGRWPPPRWRPPPRLL